MKAEMPPRSLAVDVLLEAARELTMLPLQLLLKLRSGEGLACVARQVSGVSAHVRDGDRLATDSSNRDGCRVSAFAGGRVTAEGEFAHGSHAQGARPELVDGGQGDAESIIVGAMRLEHGEQPARAIRAQAISSLLSCSQSVRSSGSGRRGIVMPIEATSDNCVEDLARLQA